jgi:hypothetical protein
MHISSEKEASYFLWFEKAIEMIGKFNYCSTYLKLRFSVFHIIMLLSFEQDAKILSSGEKAISNTSSLCCKSVILSSNSLVPQICINLLSWADAISLLSFEKAI